MSEEAIVTLVTSESFIVGAQVLATSLRHVGTDPSRKLVALVSSSLPASSLERLHASGWHTLLVPSIPNPNTDVHVPGWRDVGFTKLNLWALGAHFSRVLYIDADCAAVANVDDVFHRRVDFAAAPDVFPPDHFNAGVMLVRPDAHVFKAMLRAAASVEAYDGGDTGFLNEFFGDWFARGGAARLPFGYNALRVMQWFTKAKPSYWESVRPLKIVHYCSSPKPWETSPLAGGDVEARWWQLFRLKNEEAKEGAVERGGQLELVMESVDGDEDEVSLVEIMARGFDASHSVRCVKAGHWVAGDGEMLGLAKVLYAAQVEVADSGTIPKVLHQIWLGSGFPEERFGPLRDSWLSKHPDWTYKLWTDADVGELELRRPELFADAETPVEKSDILRLEVLLAQGGVYVDVDFLCTRPLDELAGRAPLFAGFANTAAIEVNNGLIGSSPGHPLLKECLDSMRLSSEVADVETLAQRVLERTGPGHFTRTCFAYLERGAEDVLLLPNEFFYPLPNSLRGISEALLPVFSLPATYAVHLWACSWQVDVVEEVDEVGEVDQVEQAEPSGRLGRLVEQLGAQGNSAPAAPVAALDRIAAFLS